MNQQIITLGKHIGQISYGCQTITALWLFQRNFCERYRYTVWYDMSVFENESETDTVNLAANQNNDDIQFAVPLEMHSLLICLKR
jgi:hypothetical protein